MNKLSYAAPTTPFPRSRDDDPHPTQHSILQARVNNMARAVIGYNRAHSPQVTDLLEMFGLPSVNRLAFRLTAIEAWKALGPASTMDDNPLASLFGSPGLLHKGRGC